MIWLAIASQQIASNMPERYVKSEQLHSKLRKGFKLAYPLYIQK